MDYPRIVRLTYSCSVVFLLTGCCDSFALGVTSYMQQALDVINQTSNATTAQDMVDSEKSLIGSLARENASSLFPCDNNASGQITSAAYQQMDTAYALKFPNATPSATPNPTSSATPNPTSSATPSAISVPVGPNDTSAGSCTNGSCGPNR